MNALITAVVIALAVWLAGAPPWGIVGFAIVGAFVSTWGADAHKALEMLEIMRLDVDEIRSTAASMHSEVQSIQYDVRKD